MKKVLTILCCSLLIGISAIGCRKKTNTLIGHWVAKSGDQIQLVINADGDTIGGKEDYDLFCDSDGNFTLKSSQNVIENGTYTISGNNIIQFVNKTGLLLAQCELVHNKEIDCSKYSTYSVKYTKVG